MTNAKNQKYTRAYFEIDTTSKYVHKRPFREALASLQRLDAREVFAIVPSNFANFMIALDRPPQTMLSIGAPKYSKGQQEFVTAKRHSRLRPRIVTSV